ncbi:EAL domain, c-di-GMP-specific phosphodiesterase class I (or its enzymatically inactive variant) [Pelagirhabdus alkalitolerans]|uniref:EAL domain, c-di-GMP-specific phosphodiesterase class I (Or its enzymatically inactive variant) n=1 Tax=Pelagirhabdus alkalitolerans TaxID=1612202 RepID=A0A1G6GJ16_9BACI|nr:EAL domain-containing protein [Pelagirhabdus alkalitolerans]SDB81176.1 EAL domain, c-di-GMP-specific phosphodiesterase class I (or its enzymatically inactive variant) [Pelagirhabdus alkalitolerans]
MEEFIKNREFHHVFQPIFETSSESCLGYEGLLRTDQFSNPEHVFNQAKHEGLLYEMDIASIEEALRKVEKKQNLQGKSIFLNLLPSTLNDSRFLHDLDRLFGTLTTSPSSVVFELSEQELLEPTDHHVKQIETIQSWGCQFALDDVGKGYANFHTMIDFEFDMIKLDRGFADGLTDSLRKKAFVKSMADYCKKLQIRLVLEGIETKRDYETAKGLHIPSVQGYYLGRPTDLV